MPIDQKLDVIEKNETKFKTTEKNSKLPSVAITLPILCVAA